MRAGSRRVIGLAAIVLALTVGLVACEKPDASHVTSPSARALTGVTTGNVAYRPAGTAPEPIDDPEGWDVRLENTRFGRLENGDASIQVVMQVQARRGPAFEIWIEDARGTVLRWSGGSARPYNGVVCFQLRLEAGGEALPLSDGPYEMTVAFREPDAPQPLAARSLQITGTPPRLEGSDPGAASEVARDLLGCPRSVI